MKKQKLLGKGKWAVGFASALLMVGAAAAFAPAAAHAATSFPNGQPITLVVPYPPGGSNDSFARAVGAKLGTLLNTSIVIVNKGGASGSIGTAQVARAKPDGYTLVAVSSSFTTNAAIQENLPFDAEKDFKAVALMAQGSLYRRCKGELAGQVDGRFDRLGKKGSRCDQLFIVGAWQQQSVCYRNAQFGSRHQDDACSIPWHGARYGGIDERSGGCVDCQWPVAFARC